MNSGDERDGEDVPADKAANEQAEQTECDAIAIEALEKAPPTAAAARREVRRGRAGIDTQLRQRRRMTRDIDRLLETHRTVQRDIEAIEAPVRRLDRMTRDLDRLLEPQRAWQRKLAAINPPFHELDRMAQAIGSVSAVGQFDRPMAFHTAVSRLLEPQTIYQQQVAALLTDTLTTLSLLPDLSTLTRLPGWFYPPNWASLADDESDVDSAIEILCEEGIPLAWVPRAEIVADLVHAPDAAARVAILHSRRLEIIEDCRGVLNETTEPTLKPLIELAREALTALEHAPAAAQALAANLFDTFLRDANRRGQLFGGNFGYFKYEKVATRIRPVSDATTVGDFRIACVLTPALLALDTFNPDADPVPTRFGRHPTAHRADPVQYTPANAVIAVMLVTSLLRQAHESGW